VAHRRGFRHDALGGRGRGAHGHVDAIVAAIETPGLSRRRWERTLENYRIVRRQVPWLVAFPIACKWLAVSFLHDRLGGGEAATRSGMKIGFVSLARHGGTLRCAVNLADALAAKTMAFLCRIPAAGLHPSVRARLVREHRTRSSSEPGLHAQPAKLPALRRFIRAADPDVVCFPLGHAWNAAIAGLIGKVPQVYILHDPQRHLGESSRVYTALERWHLKRVKRVIVLSRVFQTPPEGCPHLPVDVMPHGEFGAFEPYVAPPTRQKLLFLGRFRAYKGLPLLIEGFRQSRRLLPQVQLTIAGSGSMNWGPFPPGVTLISKWLPMPRCGSCVRRTMWWSLRTWKPRNRAWWPSPNRWDGR